MGYHAGGIVNCAHHQTLAADRAQLRVIFAVFKKILPFEAFGLFDGLLAAKRTAFFQFVLFILAI